jgi:hypothetical protein
MPRRTRFTPEPWHYSKATKTITVTQTGQVVAYLDDTTNHANNGRLIAKAPELHKALAALLDRQDPATIKSARALLAAST